MTSDTLICGCGAPIHYSNATSEAFVLEMIERFGYTVDITTVGGTWKVPRHFVALHGIKGSEVGRLASQYGWERVA